MSYFPPLISKPPYRLNMCSDGLNAGVARNYPCVCLKIIGTNISQSARYLKLYDKASLPVIGTDIPVTTITIAGYDTAPEIPPMRFNNGIAYVISSMIGDNSTSPISAGDITGLNVYTT